MPPAISAAQAVDDSVPVQIDYDTQGDIITINGIKYSAGIFRRFAIAPVGTVLRIEGRQDGVLTVRELERPV